MMTSRLFAFVALAIAAAGCRDAKGKDDPVVRPAPIAPTATPTPVDQTGSGSAAPKKDLQKGDQQDNEWTPAEHKAGMSRWKDTGVYVDGKPIGFLQFGELPIALKPTWIKDKVSDRKRPGTNDPGWKWAQQRFYKFTDYFKAVGLDIRKIKEIHVYGPKLSQTLIATQKDLAGPHVDKFMFRFGANTGGKAIVAAPGEFGNGKTSDKLSAVMIYIDKKPPVLIRNQGLELDGVMQTGVPYYGEPIRGGVRIYLDDKLAGIIKRQELDPKKATKGADGELRWKLADVFAAQGIDASKVVEAWLVRDELRERKLPGDSLATMMFSASAQAHGGIQLTEEKLKANALALHTRPLKQDEIPKVTEWDE
jgi:hypothetical protein